MPGTGVSTRDMLAAGAQTLPLGFYSGGQTHKPAVKTVMENITGPGQAAVGGASNYPWGGEGRRGSYTETGQTDGVQGALGKFLPEEPQALWFKRCETPTWERHRSVILLMVLHKQQSRKQQQTG